VDGIVGWGKFRTGTITGGNVLGLVPEVGVKFSELTSIKASFFNKAWHAFAPGSYFTVKYIPMPKSLTPQITGAFFVHR